MTEKNPTQNEWSRLYAAATKVKDLAPWQWMSEEQVFGVRNPETGETGFVSVMGAGGEHFSIAVYPDAAALYGFLRLQEDAQNGEAEIGPERVLEIPQLQASFEDRDYLEKEDRELMKKLGLKFRGAKSWPMFRDYSPGFLPWFVNGAQARFLTLALEQLLEVAPRIREDEFLLPPSDHEDFLVRAARQDGKKLIWEDQTVSVTEPPPVPLKVELDPALIAQLKQKPLRDSVIEFDVAMLPTPYQEKKDRPRFPYLMVVLDSQSGMVLGTNMLQLETTVAELRGGVPNNLAKTLAQFNAVPKSIVVGSEWLAEALKPLASEVGLKIYQADRLPAVEAMMGFMRQMPMFGG